MFKFGKKKPRSLKSFGIAGLLNEDALVFYDQAFHLTHIGGATDLLAARLKKSNVNEIKFRKALLISYLDAFERMAGSEDMPVELECGIDAEKIVIGVSYNIAKDTELSVDDLKEKFIDPLEGVSDFSAFKFQPASGKCESIAVFTLNDSAMVEIETEKEHAWFVELGQKLENTPKIENYEELGDLDKAKLLADPKNAPPPEASKIVIKEDNSLAKALNERKKSKKPVDDEKESRFGVDKIDEGKSKVKGAGDFIDGSKVDVKGEKGQKESLVRVKGEEEEEKEDYNVISGLEEIENDPKKLKEKLIKSTQNEKKYISQIYELQRKIRDLQQNLNAANAAIDQGSSTKMVDLEDRSAISVSGEVPKVEEKIVVKNEAESKDETSEKEDDSGMFGILKGVWDSKVSKIKKEDDAEKEAPAQKVESHGATEEAQSKENEDEQNEPDDVAKSLVATVDGGNFDKTIEKVKENVNEHAKSAKSDKAKKYAESLIHDLNQEKAKVRDLVRRLSNSIRQKEAEFKNKERMMRDEMRRKDDELRQKQTVLQRTKDQLSHTSMNLERYKTTVRKTASEGQFKKKYEYLQQNADKMKTENSQLKRKIEELKSSINANLNKNTRAVSSGSMELKVLKDRNDKITKGYDEEKRKNRNLMERLTDADRDRGRIEDKLTAVSEKLEKAIRVAMDKKKDNQRLKGEFEKVEAEKMVLARKVKELQRELNRAKSDDDSDDDSSKSGSSAA